MKRFLRYFLQGLLFVIPVAFTVWIIVSSVQWIDSIIPRLLSIDLYPGVGFVIIIGMVTAIGYLGSTLIAKPAFTVFENFLYKVPFINLIYSSIKDVMGAFVGDKRKFNQPVLVRLHKESDNYRLGFITQNDLKILDIQDKVAVYFPHSYNISGNLFIVPKSHITILNAPSSEVMKFIVSGGVSGLNH